MIWSEYAIDYKAGFDLVDTLTNKVYTEEQAYNLPQDIKTRIVLRPKKIGCMIYTTEECEEMLKERRKENLRQIKENGK